MMVDPVRRGLIGGLGATALSGPAVLGRDEAKAQAQLAAMSAPGDGYVDAFISTPISQRADFVMRSLQTRDSIDDQQARDLSNPAISSTNARFIFRVAGDTDNPVLRAFVGKLVETRVPFELVKASGSDVDDGKLGFYAQGKRTRHDLDYAVLDDIRYAEGSFRQYGSSLYRIAN